MKEIVAIAAILFVASSAPAQVVGGQPKMDSSVPCEALQWDWQHIEKRMAFDFAVESNNYKVPSTIELHLAERNDYARASLVLQLMKENGCPIPKRAPRSTTYSDAAFACIRARKAAASDAPSLCTEDKWMPNP